MIHKFKHINLLYKNLIFCLLFILGACDSDNNVNNPIIDAPTVKVGEKQNVGIYPALKPNWVSNALSKRTRLDLNELKGQADFKVLETVEAVDLFAYLSGFYPEGHSFPVIFFNRKEKTFRVSSSKFQVDYPYQDYNKALMSYKAILIKSGYPITGVDQKSKQYVWKDGEKIVLDVTVTASDHALNAHFTEEQYTFMYNFLRPHAGFAYLSGVANTDLDHPLMYGRNGKNEAFLTIMGKGMALEFGINELDSAFKAYYELVNTPSK